MKKEIPCEVYSRVVGYYRPVHNWNKGKRQEFNERLTFDEKVAASKIGMQAVPVVGGGVETHSEIESYKIFTFPDCSKCEEVKEFFKDHPLKGTVIDLKSSPGNKEFREYYNIKEVKEKLVRDDSGSLKLPIVMFMNGNCVVDTAQGLEETKSILA